MCDSVFCLFSFLPSVRVTNLVRARSINNLLLLLGVCIQCTSSLLYVSTTRIAVEEYWPVATTSSPESISELRPNTLVV